jgi:hypothetical protein
MHEIRLHVGGSMALDDPIGIDYRNERGGLVHVTTTTRAGAGQGWWHTLSISGEVPYTAKVRAASGGAVSCEIYVDGERMEAQASSGGTVVCRVRLLPRESVRSR